MQDIETLTALFDNKILSILAVLANDTSGRLYLREISKYSKVSDASTYRIIQKLIRLGLVEQMKIKKLKLYRFKNTDKTEFLFNMLKKDIKVLQLFIDEIKKLEGVQSILLHGKENNERANVLLIGSGIDSDKVKEICGSIKVNHNFIISPLILALEQFEQMSSMGLYSGKEKVLFSK